MPIQIPLIETVGHCPCCNCEAEQPDLRKCDDCEKTICHSCDFNISNPEKKVCENCFDETYCTCERCNEVLAQDLAHLQDDNWYCEHCFDTLYTSCADCSDMHLRNDTHVIDNGDNICQSCIENNYSTCDSCDSYTHSDNINSTECEQYLCNSCYSEHNNNCESCNESNNSCYSIKEHCNNLKYQGSDAILDYHPSINWEFKADKTDAHYHPYFGIELEIECVSENYSEAVQIIGEQLHGKCICCHDGSLGTYGFELITTPMKLQEFKKINFKKLFKDLIALGCRSYEPATCGLHVHLEQSGFFDKSIRLPLGYNQSFVEPKKLYHKFFNLLRQDITEYSQRNPEQIERYCNFGDYATSKYSAVNIDGNDDTIEVRIWRGTLNYRRFKSNILFTLAVRDFIQAHRVLCIKNLILPARLKHHASDLILSAYIAKCTQDLTNHFTAWLSTEPEYQFLYEDLKQRKLFNLTNNKGKTNYVRNSHQAQELNY